MTAVPIPAVLTVIYARDLDLLAGFYRRVLGLAQRDAAEDHVLLGDDLREVAIVRMSCAAAAVPLHPPGRAREAVALKVSFAVPDLEQACAEAVAAGGWFKPLGAAWCWRAQRHLDGMDPEGNVLQLRDDRAG